MARSLAYANDSEIYEKQFEIHSKIGLQVKYKLVDIYDKKYRKKDENADSQNLSRYFNNYSLRKTLFAILNLLS